MKRAVASLIGLAAAIMVVSTGCTGTEPTPARPSAPVVTPRPAPAPGAACSFCSRDSDCNRGLRCFIFSGGSSKCASGVGATCPR